MRRPHRLRQARAREAQPSAETAAPNAGATETSTLALQPRTRLGNRATERLLQRLRAQRLEAISASPELLPSAQDDEQVQAPKEGDLLPIDDRKSADPSDDPSAPDTTAPDPDAEGSDPVTPVDDVESSVETTQPSSPDDNGLQEPEAIEDLGESGAPVVEDADVPAMPTVETETAPDADAASQGAVPTPEPESDAPMRPGPQLAAWHGRTVGAAQAITTPQQPRAAGAAAAVQTQGTRLRQGRSPRREAITEEAEEAISEAPEEVNPPPEPPPDPVPEANTLVENTADKTLTTVTLPELVPSPRGSQPLVPDPTARRPPPEENTEAGTAAQEGEPATNPEPTPEDAQAAEAVTEAANAPVPEIPPGTAEGVTITDTPPPPRDPLPPNVGNLMRDVMARLLVNPAAQAAPIMTSARRDAYPNQVLPGVFPDIAEDQMDGLTETLSTSLHLIATDAGIAADSLEAAVESHRAAVTTEAETAVSELESTNTQEQDAMSSESGDELAEVGAAEDAQRSRTTATVQAATGEGSPQVIDARRDAQVSKINRRVADIRFGYGQAKTRRHQALDRARGLQNRAYDQTRNADLAAIDAALPGNDQMIARTLQKGQISVWADTQKRTLGTTIQQKKTAATTQSDGFIGKTTTAGLSATDQVRTWASEQKGETRTWWDDLWAMFSDWSEQADQDAANWSVVRAGEARDATVQNMGVLSDFMRTQGEAVNLETNAAFQTLSAEQQAVVRAYYAAPAGSRDTLGAVAEGLKFRLAAQQKQPLIDKMKQEVLAKPWSEAPQLDQIGAAERAGFSAEAISSELYDAMFGGVTGWGTDEEQIYRNLTGLTPVQGKAVRATYRQDHGSNLDSDLRSELDEDNALVRARAALDGDVVLETVGALNEAMDGIGTDEDTIMRMLRGKTAEQRAQINAEYRRRYGVDLQAELDSEMDDHDQDRAVALLQGDTARADAIAINQAMEGGFLGWGTDEAQIEGVYSDIRGDVAGEQVPDGQGGMRQMTQEEMEAEVLRRNNQVEAVYDTEYGNPDDQESALRRDFNAELSGPDLDLVNALADNNLVAADAARLERERRGFYTDDDVVNGVLENQFGRSLEALRRDPEWSARRRAIMDQAARENWDPYRTAEALRGFDSEMEAAAREGGRENMRALEEQYDSEYSRWGSGGLQTMIVFNMSGTDREKAQALVEQGGFITRAQRFDFATRGLGTDEAEAKRALSGATAAEIAEIDQVRARNGQESVRATINSEMDGRDRFDTQMMAEGVPENADQEMSQSRRRTNFELRNSPIQGHQRDVLSKRLARMEAQHALINDPDADPFLRERALAQFRQRAQGVQAGVDSYRAQVDAVADAAATAAALTAAIVVTVLTGGVAGAVLGALAAAAMTMSVKAGLKGAAYGADEMAVDAIVGIVDAAAAYATFGMGNALLRVATSQGGRIGRLGGTQLAGRLARMAGSSSRVQRMLAHGAAEAIEGAAGALPSALAGNMLNDQNWEQGNPFTNILGGTLMETGMGGLMGGGMGSLGGFSMPKVDPPAPRTGDILAHRGTPQDRLDAWRAFELENPGSNRTDFLRRYDDQISDRLAAEARDADVQRALRTELFAGIPPRQRGQFKGVEIEIMSDADFRAFTRSDSGNAVTIIENGKARVIMRDGAPPGVLREEGIHLQQMADPELGPLARRLDERRMQDWDSLDLAEQMELYSIKVELEIDAQIRLIDGLDADIRQNGVDVDLDGLRRQRAAAEESLTNLRRRADEVAAVGPLDRVAMARGLRDPPPYLDQPARLFNKTTLSSTPDGTIPRNITPRTKDPAGGVQVFFVPMPLQGGALRPGAKIDIDIDQHQMEMLSFDASGVTATPIPVGSARTIAPDTAMTGYIVTADVNSGAITLQGEPISFRVGEGGSVVVDQAQRQADVSISGSSGASTRFETETQVMSLHHSSLEQRAWQPRGGQSVRRGDIGELASRRGTERAIREGKDAGLVAQFDVQNESGHGFDGLELHLGTDGVPRLTLLEVKNYTGRVSYEDFTAIAHRTIDGKQFGNLIQNLEGLHTQFSLTNADLDAAALRHAELPDVDLPDAPVGHGMMGGMDVDDNALSLEDVFDLADQAEAQAGRAAEIEDIANDILADRLGIPRGQLDQVQQALRDGNIDIELRTPDVTLVGQRANSARPPALDRLSADLAAAKAEFPHLLAGAAESVPAPKHILNTDLDAATQAYDATRGLGFSRSMAPTGSPDFPFMDDAGRMLSIMEMPKNSANPTAAKVAEITADIQTRLQANVPLSNGLTGKPHILVDVRNLNAAERAQLEQEITEALRDALPVGSPIDIASRVVFWPAA